MGGIFSGGTTESTSVSQGGQVTDGSARGVGGDGLVINLFAPADGGGGGLSNDASKDKNTGNLFGGKIAQDEGSSLAVDVNESRTFEIGSFEVENLNDDALFGALDAGRASTREALEANAFVSGRGFEALQEVASVAVGAAEASQRDAFAFAADAAESSVRIAESLGESSERLFSSIGALGVAGAQGTPVSAVTPSIPTTTAAGKLDARQVALIVAGLAGAVLLVRALR